MLAVVWILVVAVACAPVGWRDVEGPELPPYRDGGEALEGHGLGGAAFGFLLLDLESGAVLAEHDTDRLFIPASTAKLLSAAAALDVLGAEHRFVTVLRGAGAVVGGRLNGDLRLVGGGDPMLGADGLMQLATALRHRGVRRVDGRFLVDPGGLPLIPEIEPRQPDAAGYNPGVGGLAFDFNRTRLSWREGRDDGLLEAYATPDPEKRGVGLVGDLPAGTTAVRREGRWSLSRTVSGEGETWVPVRDPAMRAARMLAMIAEIRGVDLPPPESVPNRQGKAGDILAVHRSPPLREVLRAGLEYSNNLVSEMVGLATSSRIEGGVPRSLAESAQAVRDWLRRNVSWADWSEAILPNHSGLSTEARITPAQMVAFLRFADHHFDDPSFIELLPAAGIRGAFGGRFRQPDAAFRLWAKTGTMHYASGLAGYLTTAGGRRAAFALFVTDFERRAAFDALGNPDSPEAVSAAEEWRTRAKAFEEALVRGWIAAF